MATGSLIEQIPGAFVTDIAVVGEPRAALASAVAVPALSPVAYAALALVLVAIAALRR